MKEFPSNFKPLKKGSNQCSLSLHCRCFILMRWLDFLFFVNFIELLPAALEILILFFCTFISFLYFGLKLCYSIYPTLNF